MSVDVLCVGCGHPASHHRTGERNKYNAGQSRCAYKRAPSDAECPCQLHRATCVAPPIPIADPTRAVEEPQCEGDHFFENRCNACGGAQPDGPCEICPHIGPQSVCSAEHFARRPCRHCGSSNLRTVRVRAPRTA